ncbi:MAG: CCDC90 family protein [Burkholderiaceae bacterium]|jgi:class 3 adenylate cyclase|nr:CCDC90 family protein [Burkholderiaceae bacterium]
MSAVTFDTPKFVRTLEAAGVAGPQAEAIASAVRDSHETAELATKSDLRELELRMTIKLGTMMAAAVGATVALMKLL